jgi:peroxiredoxin
MEVAMKSNPERRRSNGNGTRTQGATAGINRQRDNGRDNTNDYGNESSDARTLLQPRTPAPDFALNSTPDQRVELKQFRGRPVILALYPADWSPVCGDQLALYNEILDEFKKHDAQLLGISVDGVWCHTAYAQDRKLHFPLLADFEPKGAAARVYGAYRHGDGVCERALFVIDPDGIIRWSYLSPLGVNPGADGILNALEALPARNCAQASARTAEANHACSH